MWKLKGIYTCGLPSEEDQRKAEVAPKRIKQTICTISDTSENLDGGGDKFERRKNSRILAGLLPTAASIGTNQIRK